MRGGAQLECGLLVPKVHLTYLCNSLYASLQQCQELHTSPASSLAFHPIPVSPSLILTEETEIDRLSNLLKGACG